MVYTEMAGYPNIVLFSSLRTRTTGLPINRNTEMIRPHVTFIELLSSESESAKISEEHVFSSDFSLC